MSDPSNLVTNPPSTVVKIVNTSRDDMNGQLGIVTSYNDDRARYLVHMVSTQTTTAMKPENLARASTLEQYKAQYHQLRNDPRVRAQLRQYYQKAQARLPAGIKPEVAAGGLLTFLVGTMYLVGFTKAITVMSMLMLLGTIAAPDLVSGAPWKTIATNFPDRCRGTIEQTVPAARGRVSNRIAFGLVVFMVAMVGRTLFYVPPSSRRVPEAASSAYVQDKALSTQEAAYKLGYDDAISGRPFGDSLKDTISTTARSLGEADEIDYDFVPTSEQPRKSRFGLGSAMSAYFIYKTVKELGYPVGGGGFDYQLALANLKTMEPWKMGILAFSVYNVVRSFV